MIKKSLLSPKICIVFNSGSAGDFLVNLLSGLSNVSINKNGAVNNTYNAELFKKACELFYKNNWDPAAFNIVDEVSIVNTHYYYPQLKKLFPDCKFYYIDDGDYVNTTIELYINKRISANSESLLDWLHNTNSFPQIKKIKNISDSQLKQIMINDWTKNLTLWKKSNLIKIGFDEIIDKNKCRNLIKSIVKYNLDEDLFSKIYDEWFDKNKNMINKTVNTIDD